MLMLAGTPSQRRQIRGAMSQASASEPRASRLGVAGWVLYEWGRNVFALLVTLYIFAPYFARDLVGDPKRGLELWAEIVGYGGLALAILAPFLGAIADAGGRRKPWVLVATL